MASNQEKQNSFSTSSNFKTILKDIFQSRWIYVISGVIFLLYSLWLFPWEFIQGIGPFWQNPQGDHLQHLTGMNYFLQDKWRFPLLWIPNLVYPEGTYIIYTDSLPLFAVIAKLFAFTLPTHFNYFGWWILCVYTLQGVCTVFALRALKIYTGWLLICGGFLTLNFSAFLDRFGHLSLNGHFMILLALGLALRVVFLRQNARLAFYVLSFLPALGLWIHAYLAFMILLIWVSTFLHVLSQPTQQRRSSLWIQLCLISASLAGSIWLEGYYQISPGSSGGFGLYSMNLLSPFWPQQSGIFSFGKSFLGHQYQYEGLNYLGLGVLVLLIIGGLSTGKKLIHHLYQIRWLLWMSALLVWLALSHVIYIANWPALSLKGQTYILIWIGGSTLLACLMLPKLSQRLIIGLIGLGSLFMLKHHLELLEQLRSSGRFFWPVAYLMILAALALCQRYLRPKWLVSAVCLALCLQWFDSSPLRTGRYQGVRQATSFGKKFPRQAWEEQLTKVSKVNLIPPISCADGKGDYERIGYLASLRNIPINTAYLARMPNIDCTQFSRPDFYHVENKELRAFFKKYPPVKRRLSQLKHCPSLGQWVICTHENMPDTLTTDLELEE